MHQSDGTIEDVVAIQDTLHRYARGVDRDDWELLRDCYWPDAIDEHGRYNGGIDGLILWLKEEMPRYESSMHVISNTSVVVRGNTAAVESYCVAHHRLKAMAGDPQTDRILGLRYLDRFLRRDACWRISHRRCVYEWARVSPVPDGSELSAAYLRGRRGAGDPSYELLQ